MSVSYVDGVCIAQHRIRRQVPICPETVEVRSSTHFGVYQALRLLLDGKPCPQQSFGAVGHFPRIL